MAVFTLKKLKKKIKRELALCLLDFCVFASSAIRHFEGVEASKTEVCAGEVAVPVTALGDRA